MKTIFTPLLLADFIKIERKKLIRIMNYYFFKIGVLGILLILILISAGWVYIKFFLPQFFHQAIIYFMILGFGLPAWFLSIVLHIVLEAHLRYKEIAVMEVIPNLLKIVLILVLGYFWQIIGICIALAISGWISFAFYYLLTIKIRLAIKIIERFPLLKKLSQKY